MIAYFPPGPNQPALPLLRIESVAVLDRLTQGIRADIENLEQQLKTVGQDPSDTAVLTQKLQLSQAIDTQLQAIRHSGIFGKVIEVSSVN